ncbi:L-threonine 3-dehydrogenase [Mycovorax composti]|uniref:L-threonine 3-dehydrogenase n=1 Tax=Mycovorax composti TaxID=2962693 RepID=A0ABZ2EKR4_9BACT
MKAAVVFQKGELPKYTSDFEEPILSKDHELIISVKASAIKNLDKLRASGNHYSVKEIDKPFIVGSDGVGHLENGQRVYAIGLSGMMAEKAIVPKDEVLILPDGVSDAMAAALPNAVMGSSLVLLCRAKLQKGEVVLINGATGVTGKMAIQLAKYYGARKVVATGRNEKVFDELISLGADEVISLNSSGADFTAAVKRLHQQSPVDVVLDYLWGASAEHILHALSGNIGYSHRTRFITVGALAGDKITLSSSTLRGTDISLLGSGLGTWRDDEMKFFLRDLLPETFRLAADNKIKMDILEYTLENIEDAWCIDASGKRVVVRI